MGETEKQEILRILQEGSDTLAEALAGVDDALARSKPAPDCWSILECVEHLALTEAGLLSRLRAAQACDESHEDRAREAKFHSLALNRARRIEAPEIVRPSTCSATLARTVENFHAVRAETVSFIEEFPGELRRALTTHPLITKPVNCYEMLLLMALHPHRHALQIVEIRDAMRRRPQPV